MADPTPTGETQDATGVLDPVPTPTPVRPAPQDHLPSKAEIARDREIEDAAYLATLPPLKDANRLRIRDRNGILRIAANLEDFELEEGKEVDLTDPKFMGMLDVIAEFDEYAEKHLALDVTAYQAWASDGDVYDKLGNLIAWYARAVGESISSSD